MKIDCENCGKSIDDKSEVCEYCEAINHLHVDQEDAVSIDECCDSCAYYKPAEDIQCKTLARIHKWDRDTLEIDSPDTFRCGGYDAR